MYEETTPVHIMQDSSDFLYRVEKLNAIGKALTTVKDTPHLLEMILQGAKTLTNADGGTLYLITEDQHLRFAFMHTSSLGIRLGGPTRNPVPFRPIPLYDEHGHPNLRMVAAYAVHQKTTVNMPDVYTSEEFDFSGTHSFDRQTGYLSRSFLTVPLKNHDEEIIGVLQLINALERRSGQIVTFGREDQQLAESLASQAAIALSNQQLINSLRHLFEKFIEVIAIAIDEKSPYTGGHCRRVPELAMLMAHAVNETRDGPLADFQLSEEQLYELRIAALLHDCGKITTPVHIVDKSTKLETIFDRIEMIDTRFEVLKRDAEILYLKKRIAAAEAEDAGHLERIEQDYQRNLWQLDGDRNFLRQCNIGAEYMGEDERDRVREIASHTWIGPDGKNHRLLTEEEIENLVVPKGTLTQAERDLINQHIVSTINMLEALPFPRYLRNVPEIAGGHHERMDGTGYPRGLKREDMSVQARIMGIADIFEALTAADRPYKVGMKLSEALKILEQMKERAHIDPDLYDVFLKQRVYLQYAQQFLENQQIDTDGVSSSDKQTPQSC
jgi:HD-GYP domain-containing protein (c-di-GMP phosphodiesterase class II)